MKFFKFLLKLVLFIIFIGITIYLYRAFDSRNLPDLSLWHTLKPDPELLLNGNYTSFEDFVKADEKYIESNFKKVESIKLGALERYNPNDISYPLKSNEHYNSSFVLDPGKNKTKAVIVLIHGLSDSPYHIRDLAKYFRGKGYYVFGLRLPGHGTLPSGLLDVTWQDWYKAVQWSMQMAEQVSNQRGNIDVFLGGFSTGGALSIHHSLLAAKDKSLVMPKKVFLFSPAAGVDKLAVVASWHKALSWSSYFEKFAWLDVLPEYDPAKYMSFTKNAGRQVFLLCEENKELAAEINEENNQGKLPAFIAFESWVDATVNVKDLVELFRTIGDKNDKLVLVDVNRGFTSFMHSNIVKSTPKDLFSIDSEVFTVRILTNKLDSLGGINNQASIFNIVNNEYADDQYKDIYSSWPKRYFALSHIGLPISEKNKLYGVDSYFSHLQVYGERGVLLLSAADNMRIRYNPFFNLMTKEIDRFID